MKKFKQNDIFINQLKTYPSNDFIIIEGKLFYNNRSQLTGTNVSNIGVVPVGYKNLYELNVDRSSSEYIKPYITKQGQISTFKTISTASFREDFSYGDILTGSYNLSSSISSDYFAINSSRTKIVSLKNTLNYYKNISSHYAYTASEQNSWDKSTQEMRLISIPSIFYGSKIQKGTVEIKFYISGTIAGTLKDEKQNGELIQTFGSYYSGSSVYGSGSVAGVVLYNEGFIILTGTWPVSNHIGDYGNGNVTSSWVNSLFTGTSEPSSSFSLHFSGTNYIPSLTMFCHAEENELNYSNNPTFADFSNVSGNALETYGKESYYQNDEISIKNTIKSNFSEPTASFEKQVFISRIGIYDKDKNLIGIAKLSKPIRKRESDGFSFKIKSDL